MGPKKPAANFAVGDKVFAKVRGYPAWPARIEEVMDAKGGPKYKVFFFGTYESATMKKDELWLFSDDTKKKYGNQMKRKSFPEAMHEIEHNSDIKTREQLIAEGSVTAEMMGQESDEKAFGKVTYPTAVVDEPDESEIQDTTPARQRKKSGTPSLTSASTKSAAASAIAKSAASMLAKTPKTPDATPPARSARGAKRKAEDTPAATPPPAKQRAEMGTPSSQPTSRSGRVIKQKKFLDDQEDGGGNEQPLTPTAASASKRGGGGTPASSQKEQRKMWVQVKATGDVIEINLDKDRPASFHSRDAEVQWERATARNALKFKEKVESGEFIPEEVRKKLEQKTERTKEEEDIIKRGKQIANRQEKVRALKTEQKLADLDLLIKQSLHFQRPEMSKCLEHLNSLHTLPVTPLMLKKQPTIVTTIRKLRKYVGPQSVDDEKLGEQLESDAQKIRLKANQIFMKLQSAFAVPEGSNFWETFEGHVTEFRNATSTMERSKIMSMVSDPTNHSKRK